MIAPEKRKDAQIALAVCPELRRHLNELVASGTLGEHGRSTSDAVRAMLAQVVARMEAGDVLTDSPYERVPTKLGERISFRCDEAFSERIKALRTSDNGGRGSRSLTAFWIDLVGRAVALARVGELWARPQPAGLTVRREPHAVVPVSRVDGQGQHDTSTERPPFGLTAEEWEQAQKRFFEALEANRVAARHPPNAERQVRSGSQVMLSDPEAEAVLAGLVRAHRLAWAVLDDRPLPQETLRIDHPTQAFIDESVKLVAEMLRPDEQRRR